MVSLGTSADIDFSEVLSFLSTDSNTAVLLLHIERVAHEKAFLSALREPARRMPVVVLKSGRHENAARDGAQAPAGAEPDAVFESALERSGAMRAMTVGQLFAAAEVLTSKKPTKGTSSAV